jgi:hypothetical protein
LNYDADEVKTFLYKVFISTNQSENEHFTSMMFDYYTKLINYPDLSEKQKIILNTLVFSEGVIDKDDKKGGGNSSYPANWKKTIKRHPTKNVMATKSKTYRRRYHGHRIK